MARFSSRIEWSRQTGAIANAASGSGPLLDLTQSNPTVAGIRYPPGLLDALGDPAASVYDPDPAGSLNAREAVVRYYDGRIPPDRVLLTASTSEAYSWLFKLLCDPGDEILVPRPSYPLFEFLANLENVSVVHYPMHFQEGWFIDLDALKQAITARTRAIVFVHPNNPTGSFLKPHEYQFLAGLGLPLIIDEVFLDYPFGPPVPTLATKNDVLTFTLSGLSKVCGLPQIKLGWMVVGGPETTRHDAWVRLELIADTFLSVSTPAQVALPRLLEARHDVQLQIRNRTRLNLDLLRAGCLLEPEGGWSATLRVPRIRTEEEWVLHLIQDWGVLVHPGFYYDFDSEAYLILSLLTEPVIFAEGARRIILATDAYETSAGRTAPHDDSRR